MASPWKSHVVVSGSVEHAFLASASMATPRTRRQLLVIALDSGLKFHDDLTVGNALTRLKGRELLRASRGRGGLIQYFLTARGEQVLQALDQT